MTNENRANLVPRIRFIADGTTTDFFYSFTVFSPEDIDVYINEELQSQNYQVSIDKENGGKITFDTAPAEGSIITLLRNLKIKRTSDFQENGTFRAKVINHELDYQVATLQQLDEKIGRTMIFPPYAPTELDVSLPMPQAGKAIVWNESGDGLVNSGLEINTAFKDIQNAVDICQNHAALSVSAAGNADSKAAEASVSAETAVNEAERAVAAAEEAAAASATKANLNLDNITSLSDNAKEKIHTTFGINPSGVIQYASATVHQASASGYVIVTANTGSGNGGFISIGNNPLSLVQVAQIDTVNQGYVTVHSFVAKGQYFIGTKKNAPVYFYPLMSGE